MPTLRCEICAGSFDVKPYRATTARFCSRACKGAWIGSLPFNKQPKPYMRGNRLRAGLRPANAFTSEQVSGSGNPRWVPPVPLRCEHCGASFERKPNEVRGQRGTRFCSRECFKDSGCFREAGSTGYRGGPTTVRGENWRAIRGEVVAEQRGYCAGCGRHMGSRLHVHHRRPFRYFETAAEANARPNLVGLCPSCHRLADAAWERENAPGPPSSP